MTARSGRRPANADGGSALLAVIGAVAVLAALGFATAAVARSALDRASLRADSGKAYFLARAGIEAALHNMSVRLGRGLPLALGRFVDRYEFSAGTVQVTAVSEAGKLNVNRADRDTLESLLQSIGVSGAKAELLADRILDYRDGLRSGIPRRFAPTERPAGDRRAPSSFRRRAASIEMIEELLSVQGITPDLMYGRFEPVRDAHGRSSGLRRIGGLLGFLRVEGPAAVDLNAAPREVLLASGMQTALTDRVVAARQARRIRFGDPLLDMAVAQGARVPLAASAAASEWMLTSTVRLFEDRATRSVTAVVDAGGAVRGIRITRWYEIAL